MKKTLKTALALCFSLTLTTTYAQCVKKVDDMTKEVTVDTKMERIGNTGTKGLTIACFLKASVTYVSASSHYLLALVPEFTNVQTVEAGSKILLKLEDESLVTVTVPSTSISDHTTGEAFTQGTNTTIWYNTIVTTLDPSDVEKLKTKKVTKVRVNGYDYVVKGKSQDYIISCMQCIDKTK